MGCITGYLIIIFYVVDVMAHVDSKNKKILLIAFFMKETENVKKRSVKALIMICKQLIISKCCTWLGLYRLQGSLCC